MIADVRVEADVWTRDPGGVPAHLFVRASDPANGYLVAIDGAGVVLSKLVGGVQSILASGQVIPAAGAWRRVRVEAQGSELRVALDAGAALRVTDESFTTGALFLGASNALVRFDNSGIELLDIDTEAPLVSGVVADPNPVEVNGGLILGASVDDAATGGSVVIAAEYAIDGGGFTALNASDGSFDGVTEAVIAAVPAFSTAGVHDICVRGTDAAGNVSETQCILLAVYDPSAGFVTGAGWIDSPPGAYTLDPSLLGKATFGFVSRYQKGAMAPEGQTQFRFVVADLDFSSASYEWLVISGARAQYKGSGTINGMGEYGFMLTAIDGEINGGGGTDKFRLKIWDKATDAVIYDNESGDSDTADPTTVIGAGGIVVHK